MNKAESTLIIRLKPITLIQIDENQKRLKQQLQLEVHIKNRVDLKKMLFDTKLTNLLLDNFLKNSSLLDESRQQKQQIALYQNQRLAYVGMFENNGGIIIEPQTFSLFHLFACLKETTDLQFFKARYYFKQPLIIQGPKAETKSDCCWYRSFLIYYVLHRM